VQDRLEFPAPAAPEPLDREAEPALELVEALERLELVRVEGDEQGAGGARLQGAPGGGGKLPEKGGVGRGAGQVQVEKGVLAEGCLGDRGEHPGGVVRGRPSPALPGRGRGPRGPAGTGARRSRGRWHRPRPQWSGSPLGQEGAGVPLG